MRQDSGTISFFVGDILYDGFNTTSLLYLPLECALDDLNLRYEFDDRIVVLVNGERVNRTWYTLQPGDEVKIVTAAGEPRQVVGQAAPPMEPDEFGGECSTTRTELAASIAANLRRIADHFDPPPPDLVGTPYIAERLGCTTVWVTEMVRSGEIPPSCVVPGTGNGKPWKFRRARIDEWLRSR